MTEKGANETYTEASIFWRNGLVAKGFDTHACDRLSRIPVLDPIRTTFESRCDNERIPESDLGFILDSECS
jgi:hypothetical protein